MLISSKNLDQHLKHLEKFIDLCISNGIGLSRKKTIIGEPKIDFLSKKKYRIESNYKSFLEY